MVATKKDALNKNKKWWQAFAEEIKKNRKQSATTKTSSGWVSEINCTQEDIGEPNYSLNKSKKGKKKK